LDEKKQLEECPSKEGSSDVKVTEGNICWVEEDGAPEPKTFVTLLAQN
jgi:hypothetical protein